MHRERLENALRKMLKVSKHFEQTCQMRSRVQQLALEDRRGQEPIIYSLDPLQDSRWSEFVTRHPRASVFHTTGWLQALQRTYGYDPVAFTTSAPNEALRNGLVFCAVRSWLTGSRLVSLPFSDHCEPLVETVDDMNALYCQVQRLATQGKWRYIEIRSRDRRLTCDEGFQIANSFYLHRVDLRPTLDSLLRSFHKDCVQRKLRRAVREGLRYEVGRSETLVRKLYSLLHLTRRRHHLPPQPLQWFRNIVSCVGEDACVRIVSKENHLAAGILTLNHGKTVVYKYGGSDTALNNLGGMALLFWKTIQEAKEAGAEVLDLGRSDHDNPGLIAFKDHWAAARSTLTYWRSAARGDTFQMDGRRLEVSKKIFHRLPSGLLVLAGKLLYRHIG
jgi:hypothetical protein